MSKLFNVVRKERVIDWGEFDDVPETTTLDVPAVSKPAVNKPVASKPAVSNDDLLPAPASLETPVSVLPHAGGAVVRIPVTPSPLLPFFGEAENLAAIEQYRMIRTKIHHHSKKPKLIAISSPCSGDGKTVTSINVACAMAAQEGSSVLLVDGDLRRSRVSKTLGIPARRGLSEIISGGDDLESTLITTEEIPNLFLLPAGQASGSMTELLDSQRWRYLIQQLRARFTTVIFDAPPVESIADYTLLQLSCDGVVLVLRPDHTDRRGCVETFAAVPKDKLLGVVLNAVENYWFSRTPFYGYYQDPLPGRR